MNEFGKYFINRHKTTMADAIRAAIPSASLDLCEHILWERTPYPMGKITARSLYKAASGWKRAFDNGVSLCELCDRRVDDEKYICSRCGNSLAGRM